jgi:hypothetical protein
MESMKRSIAFLRAGPGGPATTPSEVISEVLVMIDMPRITHDRKLLRRHGRDIWHEDALRAFARP